MRCAQPSRQIHCFGDLVATGWKCISRKPVALASSYHHRAVATGRRSQPQTATSLATSSHCRSHPSSPLSPAVLNNICYRCAHQLCLNHQWQPCSARPSRPARHPRIFPVPPATRRSPPITGSESSLHAKWGNEAEEKKWTNHMSDAHLHIRLCWHSA